MATLLEKLNKSLQAKEVPLAVVVGADLDDSTDPMEDQAIKGKFMQASQDVQADTVLFIECPLVSWRFHTRDPTQSLRCDYCLKALRESTKSDSGEDATVKCSECAECKAAFFCDDSCLRAASSSGIHAAFCGAPVAALRSFTAKLESGGSDRYNFNVEALSRCIGVVCNKFLKYAEALLQQGEAAELDVQTSFGLATDATFDQFVAAPDTSALDIEVQSWLEVLRAECTKPLYKYLKKRVARLLLDHANLTDPTDEITAMSKDVANTVAEALLSDETVLTFLGQLLFNSTSINAPVKAALKQKGGGAKSTPCSVGAGLFSLQSCFNHSCDPNMTVQFSQEDNTMEVRTLKAIQAGEEATISYLNADVLLTEPVEGRRHLLAPYLFECQCPRCLLEVSVVKATKGKRDRDAEEDDSDDDDEIM